ncbi:MAG: ROK family protein [Verrucomicrobia bacterium]|nr:ROK family protein [Verrucomicrobiota bacterium]
MGYPTTIGIDFGGTSIKCALTRGPERISEIIRFATHDHGSPEAAITAMVKAIAQLREQSDENVLAIGLGIPGAVDVGKGITYNLTNVPGWFGVAVGSLITEQVGLPVSMDNDANCMAYAEWKFGAAKGLRNVIAVTLGTGVGGALILDGNLYRGSQYVAGEIGQMSVDFKGVDGPYGNHGALERYIGHQQIQEIATRRFRDAGRRPENSPELTSLETLVEAARKGDAQATQVWADVACYLGTALAGVIYLLNPDAIVIGGGVAHAGDVLFDPLEEQLKSTLSEEFWTALKVIPAELGNDAGIIGSSALAADALEAK